VNPHECRVMRSDKQQLPDLACDGDSPKKLIQMLVNAAQREGGPRGAEVPQPRSQAEEVILDIDVNGSRYLLIRLPDNRAAPVLSPREREIVRMVGLGYPNKIIADVLNISFWTVSTHLRRIFAKLGVGSRAAMVARLAGTRKIEQKSAREPRNRDDSSERGTFSTQAQFNRKP